MLNVRLQLPAARAQTKTSRFIERAGIIVFLVDKLRTNYEQLRWKILKKLRTTSLNSEFSGSSKKV